MKNADDRLISTEAKEDILARLREFLYTKDIRQCDVELGKAVIEVVRGIGKPVVQSIKIVATTEKPKAKGVDDE